jgi:hypothetical protein
MRSILLLPWVISSAVACAKQPAMLSVEPASILPMERKGKSVKLKAQTKDDRGIFIATVQPEWVSSDPGVAVVAVDGTVTSVSSGKATVTGTFANVSSGIAVEVRLVGSLELSPNTPQKLRMGKNMKVKATVKDDHGQELPAEKVVFRTSGHAIGVEQDGTVTGQAVGDSVLVAGAKDKEARLSFAVDE